MSENSNEVNGGVFRSRLSKLSCVVFLSTVTSQVIAAGRGNISAAINTFIIGAIIALIISLLFSLKKNRQDNSMSLKTGIFFLILSILLLIVFVAAVASFFIFM